MSGLQTLTSPNVVVFGETGVGKSSIINMLLGKDEARISNAAVGCTFESTAFYADIDGIRFKLHDTAGLNEWEGGRVSGSNAIKNLHQLIRNLSGEGVSLLVYCIRGPRIKENTVNNYKMFYNAFCQKQVPIVAVVTGLENEEPMEGWWAENGGTLTTYGMQFSGYACVTATRGKRGIFKAEYEESESKLKQLLINHRLEKAWKMETTSWIREVVKGMWDLFSKAFDVSFRETFSLTSGEAGEKPLLQNTTPTGTAGGSNRDKQLPTAPGSVDTIHTTTEPVRSTAGEGQSGEYSNTGDANGPSPDAQMPMTTVQDDPPAPAPTKTAEHEKGRQEVDNTERTTNIPATADMVAALENTPALIEPAFITGDGDGNRWGQAVNVTKTTVTNPLLKSVTSAETVGNCDEGLQGSVAAPITVIGTQPDILASTVTVHSYSQAPKLFESSPAIKEESEIIKSTTNPSLALVVGAFTALVGGSLSQAFAYTQRYRNGNPSSPLGSEPVVVPSPSARSHSSSGQHAQATDGDEKEGESKQECCPKTISSEES